MTEPTPVTTEELIRWLKERAESCRAFVALNSPDLPAMHNVMRGEALYLAAAKDVERLNRLINVLQLRVVRDEPGEWTCWLELPCIPSRSQTTDVREFIDLFDRFDKRDDRRDADRHPPRVI